MVARAKTGIAACIKKDKKIIMAKSAARKAVSVLVGSIKKDRTNKTSGRVMRNTRPMKGIREAVAKNTMIKNNRRNGLFGDNKFNFAKNSNLR